MNLIIVKDLASTASFPAPRKRGYRAREMPAHYPKLPAALEKNLHNLPHKYDRDCDLSYS